MNGNPLRRTTLFWLGWAAAGVVVGLLAITPVA
jgi:hypothetical protein